jgi:O-antigen/teichoic acid export membrane protein
MTDLPDTAPITAPRSDADLPAPPANLTAASVSGGAWQGASVFGGAAMQFGVSIVLARLLTPADFGTVALVAIFVGIANILTFLGVGPALVQRKTLNPDYVATAWTVSVIGGVVGSVVIALCAPLLASAVGDASISIVFVAISPILLLTNLRTCSMGLLRRQMKFRALTAVDLLSYGLGYCVVAVTLALLGWGVWALVTAQLCQGALACVTAFALQRHALRFHISRSATREILDFGGGMTASGLANYVAVNGDNFVVGRTLGTSSLGLYTRAYSLMNLPMSYLSTIQSAVLLPAYSKVQEDRERITRGYLSSVYLVFTIAAPLTMFVLVAAPYLIRTLFGSQWEESIMPLRVFAFLGAFRATYYLGPIVVQALGKPWSVFARQVLYAGIVLGGAVIGSRWGIVGVAWGTSLGIIVMYVVMARLCHGLLGFSWRSLVRAHRTGLVCGLLVLAGGAGTSRVLRAYEWPNFVMLVCLAIVCVGIACLAVSLLPKTWRVDGAERAMSAAMGMLPLGLSAPLMKVFRIPAPAPQE